MKRQDGQTQLKTAPVAAVETEHAQTRQKLTSAAETFHVQKVILTQHKVKKQEVEERASLATRFS